MNCSARRACAVASTGARVAVSWRVMRLLVVLLVSLVSFGVARAHITLQEPQPWLVEDADGDPQKTAPCGGTGTPTGVVTHYFPGETITVRWRETIYHPGHFRIALTADRSALVDPMIVVDGAGNSVSAAIADPPSAPVLLDGLFPRTATSGSSGRTFEQQVTLPNVECPSCTLQVIQFMSHHATPYVYHHCANVAITAVAPAGDMARAPNTPSSSSGCNASTSSSSAVPIAVIGVAAVWLLVRRRRTNLKST